MPNTTIKLAIALCLVLAAPAASFARGGGGVSHMGMGRPNPAELGALENMSVNPSGMGHAQSVAPLPQPNLSVPPIPQFK